MSQRGDVRRMLLARGWSESDTYAVLRKGGAVWAGIAHGDSALSGPARAGRPARWTIDFGRDLPASVIVAACEAAAEVRVP